MSTAFSRGILRARAAAPLAQGWIRRATRLVPGGTLTSRRLATLDPLQRRVLALQQTHGNAAVRRLLERSVTTARHTDAGRLIPTITLGSPSQQNVVQAKPRGRKRPRLRPSLAQLVDTVRDAVEVRHDFDSIPPQLGPGVQGPPQPGGAFYYLNGQNPTDLIEGLRALGPDIRDKLLQNIKLADGKFDRPRLEGALRAVAWGQDQSGQAAITLLDAVRNAGTGSFADVFKLLAGVSRKEATARLRTLDPATLRTLESHLPDAPADEQVKLGQILRDLLGTPTMAAADVIDLERLRGLNRTMAQIYNLHGQYLEAQAQALGIGTATAAGIMKVESGGETFSAATDKPVIRFEAHVFWRLWGRSRSNRAVFKQHFKFGSPAHTGHLYREAPTDAWTPYHGNQTSETAATDFAASLASREIAYQSMSMGAGQIMGFNFASQGYSSAEAMFDDFSTGERPQIGSIFDFIRIHGLQTAVQHNDYETLAKVYNGAAKGTPKNVEYATAIRQAAAAYGRVTQGKKHVIR